MTFSASQLDSSGNYRYGDHFAGRKRLWEIRFRFNFKHRVSLSDLFFGAELEAALLGAMKK